MKKLQILAMVLLGLQFAACEKQTYLDFESIQGECIIEGVLTYNQGERMVDGVLEKIQKPLPNATIKVTVPYSSYQANSSGDKVFTTTTDENGKYSIAIPVGTKTISATIGAEPFKAIYYKYDKLVGATEIEGLYTANEQKVNLKAGAIEWVNITMSAEQALNLERNTKITIRGKVMQTAEVADVEAGTIVSVNDDYIAASNVTVLITISNENSSDVITYVKETDKMGKIEFDAMLFDAWELSKTKCVVTTKPFIGKFEHYYHKQVSWNQKKNWETQVIEGLYSEAYSQSKKMSIDNRLVPFELSIAYIPFTPIDFCTIKGIGNEFDQDDNDSANPFGWYPCSE